MMLRMFIERSERVEAAWVYPKANLLHRFIAKFLDFLVVALLYEIPLPVSFVLGMIYLLLADGFVGGSVGKRLIGLTLAGTDQGAVSFRESILRNSPFVLAYLFYVVPFVGWLVAVGIVGFESFVMVGNPKGLRLGDELAKTIVLDQRGTGSFGDPLSGKE
jgi:uncharacterized RDD family membrane protein YckC